MKDYIFIHEKFYDLDKLKIFHPGGYLKIFECISKEKDCTALFESSHCMKDIDKIYSMMKSFEIPRENYSEYGITENIISEKKIIPKFKFDNYHKLCNEVKKFFNNSDYKVNNFWYIKLIFLMFFYVFCYYKGLISNENSKTFFYENYLFAFFAGIFWVNIGFCTMHDASHYSLYKTKRDSSINSNVNFCRFFNIFNLDYEKIAYFQKNKSLDKNLLYETLSSYHSLNYNDIINCIWHGWSLWNSYIWYKHHTYAHHSFTGIFGLDPDLINLRPLARKTKEDNKVIQFLTSLQEKTIWLILIFLPGMFVGQIIGYFVGAIRGHVWKVSISEVFKKTPFLEFLIYLISLYLILINKNFICVYFYLVGLNLMYSLSIVPDHDLYESVVENEKKQMIGAKCK